jgi:hypothetical protein
MRPEAGRATRTAPVRRAHQVPGLVQVAAGGRLLAHRAEDRRAERPVTAGLSQPQRLNQVRLGERRPRPVRIRQAAGEEGGLGGRRQQGAVRLPAAVPAQQPLGIRAQPPGQAVTGMSGIGRDGGRGRHRAHPGHVVKAGVRPGSRRLSPGGDQAAWIDEQPAQCGITPGAALELVSPGEVVGQVGPSERRCLRGRPRGRHVIACLAFPLGVGQHAATAGAEPAARENW